MKKVIIYLIAMIICTTTSISLAQEIILPPPEPGSFFTVFDYSRDGRIVAFDGFKVFIQESVNNPNFVAIGTIPEEFRGGTDPAFIIVSPNGQDIILGGGAGGFKFPDPDFNGNVFSLPIEGGEAILIGRFPFHIQATFRHIDELFFGQGETFGFFTGSVEFIDLATNEKVTVVANVPGDPGGITFDNQGNLFVGLAGAQDPERMGEIRFFSKADIKDAIESGMPMDFDNNSILISQILNAGDILFDSNGDLFVGGGDLFGVTGSFGFIAEVDIETGEITDRFDPTDDDPDDFDFVFFDIAFTPARCRLAIVDLISFFTPEEPRVFERQVCVP